MFLETPRFPDKISRGVRGGPRWATSITPSRAGYEQRNLQWQDARHEYDAAYGIRDMADLEQLKEFFMTTRGPVHGFRFKDWADYRSGLLANAPTALDQRIGIGDGAETHFQLAKTYDDGIPYIRPITKPIAGTELFASNGVPVTGVLDATTGIVTLDVAPGIDEIVTAGFEFDVPCRFQQETLLTQMEVYDVGSAQVPMIEIRDIA